MADPKVAPWPVEVGPFQRIVNVHWAKPYVVIPFSFAFTPWIDVQPGDTPSDVWVSGSVNTAFIYAEDFMLSPPELLASSISGAPALQPLSYDFFAWVSNIRGYGGSGYPNDAYLIADPTGEELTEGPDFEGDMGNSDTTITIDVMHTPYSGFAIHYTNLPVGPEGPLLFRQFFGLSDPTPSLTNTISAGSVSFDFSSLVYESGGTYRPIGTYWKPQTTFGFFENDARDVGTINVIMKRDTST